MIPTFTCPDTVAAHLPCNLPLERDGTCPEHGRHRLHIVHGIAPIGGGAVFSPDRVYRYALWRQIPRDPDLFSAATPAAGEEIRRRRLIAFAGLNPSVAGADDDDATIRVCTGYTRRWGYGGFVMVNTAALVETKSALLAAHPDPVGLDNDWVLRQVAHQVDLVVACWGNLALPGRPRAVCALFEEAGCLVRVLALTRGNKPHHPLRLAGDLTPQRWNWRADT